MFIPTQTSNYGLSKPLVNNVTDQDLWGNELNDDMDDIDTLTKVSIQFIPSTKTTSFSVTAPTSASSDTGDSKKVFLCDATSASITATLPAASGCSGMTIAFKKTDSSANTVILDGNSSETIDGSTTKTLSNQYDWIVIVCDGTGWEILSQITSPADASTSVKGIVQLATAAEVLAGTSTTKAPTPDALAGNKSLASSGYYKFPGGFVMQWGITGSVSGLGSSTITFPTAFSTACYSVTAIRTGISGGPQAGDYVDTVGASTFKIHNQANDAVTFYWQAVGK